MDPRAFLDRLARDDEGSLVHVEDLPARRPQIAPFPEGVPDLLVERLRLRGVEGLYPHQRAALDHLRAGRDVILATGTASGKSLVYQAAFAEDAIADPKATALALFPTKALARDQLRSIRALTLPQVKAAAYDGDTPKEERPLIRRNANMILTNPDMLHLSLLPDHARWTDLWHRLSIVVIDEAHVLRGVFGTHVAMVLRRLRRIIELHGGSPRWCLASATVGNPGELAGELTGLDVTEVLEDTSPRGRTSFALWNPPIVDEETGARRSALAEAARIMGDLVEEGVRTIGFVRSRRGAELLAEFTRREVDDTALRRRIKSYRAGYLAEDRRAIEAQLAAGELVAVAATNALELGIDIGSLDAAVLTGYPGTRASMWQQAGRAGRRRADALAVLVAQDDPLDQYLVGHPDALFHQPAEDVVIDPTNPYVVGPHVRCAARERPLAEGEAERFFGPAGADAETVLVEAGVLTRRATGLVHDTGAGRPHDDVDVRAGAGAVYRIVRRDTGELIGTADERRAFGTLHAGAIYLHQGEQYLVHALDMGRRVALVDAADPDHTTQARDVTDIAIVGALDERPLGDAGIRFGDVHVTDQVVGFVRRSIATGEIVGEEPLTMPPVTLTTRAVWWTLPGRLLDRAGLTPPTIPGAIHAAEHAAIGLLPLIATCDRWDVGGVSTPLHPDTGLTTVFVYDGYPGGAGIAERGYHAVDRWLGATLERVRECPCRRGCPSCVVSPKCGNGNDPLDKRGAAALLGTILGAG